MTTEGQATFRRMVANALQGRCVCGRALNKQGKHCCRMCRENYGTHSHLCEKRARS
jgi:hypothetical protein